VIEKAGRLGGSLVLRHASKRSSGTWGQDDYDVIDAAGRDIGRIFKAGGGVPDDRPWKWTITGTVVAPALPSHGFAPSLEEAKAQFAETWRARGWRSQGHDRTLPGVRGRRCACVLASGNRFANVGTGVSRGDEDARPLPCEPGRR
jgi:hypothetical protein